MNHELSAKHTPGPWMVNGLLIQLYDLPIAEVIQGPTTDRQIALANANLIAAAPILLAALKLLTERRGDRDEITHCMALDAIAVAEGREAAPFPGPGEV